MSTQVAEAFAPVRPVSTNRHRLGFWITAAAFAVGMAFSTAPTPLWALYRQRDHFSTTMVTVAFAAYAMGVVVSLFLAGHASDWLGRRRVLVPALVTLAIAAVLFLVWPDLPGLIVARFLTGLGVGMLTATATAYLAELHATARPDAPPAHASLVSTAANLGGLALGPLVVGILAQYVGGKLTVPYVVFLILLIAAIVALTLVPETVRPQRRAYRPQRMAVPPHARGRYFAIAGATFGLFAILGLFTSLAPTFLASIGQSAPIVAGLAAFGVFAAAAIAQIALGRLSPPRQLRLGIPATAVGVVVLTVGVLLSSPAGFLVGGLIAGAGSGVLLKGSLSTAAMLSPVNVRGEAIAGIFLAGYVGLALPVLGIGFANAAGVSLHTALLGFAALVLAVLAIVSPFLRTRPSPIG